MLVVSLIATASRPTRPPVQRGAGAGAYSATICEHHQQHHRVQLALRRVRRPGLCRYLPRRATVVIGSPLGRALRAVRENDAAASALGKNVTALRLGMFAAGGCIAGLSGSVLVGFIQVWSPSSWLYGETFVLFTALVVGGAASNLGPVVGAVIVPVGLAEGTPLSPPDRGPDARALARMDRHRGHAAAVPVVLAGGHRPGAQAQVSADRAAEDSEPHPGGAA